MVINLINQGHEAALRRPVDLVNADGYDVRQIHAFSLDVMNDGRNDELYLAKTGNC
jgi:hypothetical protein